MMSNKTSTTVGLSDAAVSHIVHTTLLTLRPRLLLIVVDNPTRTFFLMEWGMFLTFWGLWVDGRMGLG